MDSTTPTDFVTVVISLAESPLFQYLALIGVLVVIGYVLVVVDTVRRTLAKKR